MDRTILHLATFSVPLQYIAAPVAADDLFSLRIRPIGNHCFFSIAVYDAPFRFAQLVQTDQPARLLHLLCPGIVPVNDRLNHLRAEVYLLIGH